MNNILLNKKSTLIFNEYCSKIGENPALIQGAGGNTSYKEGDTLWIKASGTQLASAQIEDIFIPLSLSKIRECITAGVSDYSAAKLSDTPLKPSIETPLHALLPHKIVIHVHAVDIIAIAVLNNAVEKFNAYFTGLSWTWIPYVKPGPALAEAISQHFQKNNDMTDILVLGNHGLVIGGESLETVDHLLNAILARLPAAPRPLPYIPISHMQTSSQQWITHGYQFIDNTEINYLAHDQKALKLIEQKWVLYPDHAVFLGGISPLILPNETPEAFFLRMNTHPACIIVPYQGVLVQYPNKKEVIDMLLCYAAVLQRIENDDAVVALPQKEIIGLLNWDAEKYRQSLVC